MRISLGIMIDSTSIGFYTAIYIIIGAALILNSLGVYVLFAGKLPISSQNLILAILSTLKIIISITEAVICTLEIYGKGEDDRVYQVVDIVNAGLYGVNDLIVIILTADRFLATMFPLPYNIRMTKTKFVVAIVTSWFVGAAGILPFFFLKYDVLYDVFYKIVFLTLDSIVLTLALITYGYILKTLVNRENTVRKSTYHRENRIARFATMHGQRNGSQRSQFFLISGLIIASFILFVSVPDAVYVSLVIIQGNENPIIESAVGLVWGLYLVADPLIYIFLQKHTKTRLKRLFFRNRVRDNTLPYRRDPTLTTKM